MNQRIQQLANQCMVEVENVPVTGTDGWTSLETVRQIDPEKFAQLIVRECARFLEANSGNDECNNAWFPEPEDLLEHFGVEE